MFRTIVVPLDGSRFAETALETAAHFARASGARLELVGVHEPPMVLVPVADIPISADPGDEEVRAQRQQYLAATALRLGGQGRNAVEYQLVDGLAGPGLAQWIESHRPDLVVMSTHGRGPLSRFWLGSVADHVVRHVSVPILLLRPKDGEASSPQLSSAIVPLDLSPEAEAILEPLKYVAGLFATHITLVHVIQPILGVYGGMPAYAAPLSPDQVEATRTRAEQQLERIADRLRSSGFQAATKVLFSMGVAGSVLQLVDESTGTFVALTTHGFAGFRRLLLGSVADKIVRGTDRPVLILRPAPSALSRDQ